MLELRVSEKGCVSVYGLRRFPVSLYPGEWSAILAEADAIRAFIAANRGALDAKGRSDSPLPRQQSANGDTRSFSERMGWNRNA